jgi:TolA-binding protein
VKSYALAKEKAGKTALGEKATYKLGWSYYQLKQYQEAFKQFADQATTYAEGQLVAEALFMKAECQFQMANYAEALPAFIAAHKAVDDDHRVSADVEVLMLLHGGQSASQLKQWEQCLDLLEPLTTRFAESASLPEAWYEIGWARFNLGKHDEAMAAYEKAVEGSRGATGARARFMMGELLFSQKKHAEAILQFQRVMYGYGGDKAEVDVKKWQSKSAYEAGRCAEVQIEGAGDRATRNKLVADATKFYTYVVEKHPGTKEAEEAGKRLAQLANLQ